MRRRNGEFFASGLQVYVQAEMENHCHCYLLIIHIPGKTLVKSRALLFYCDDQHLCTVRLCERSTDRLYIIIDRIGY